MTGMHFSCGAWPRAAKTSSPVLRGMLRSKAISRKEDTQV
jgi:hypothetical protein